MNETFKDCEIQEYGEFCRQLIYLHVYPRLLNDFDQLCLDFNGPGEEISDLTHFDQLMSKMNKFIAHMPGMLDFILLEAVIPRLLER